MESVFLFVLTVLRNDCSRVESLALCVSDGDGLCSTGEGLKISTCLFME